MKKRNLLKMPLILAALGLAFAMVLTSCDKDGGDEINLVPDTNGRLEISAFGSAYNGKKVIAMGADKDGTTGFIAAGDIISFDLKDVLVKGAQISSEKATLKVWEVKQGSSVDLPVSFSGTVTPGAFLVTITNKDLDDAEMTTATKYMTSLAAYMATVSTYLLAISNGDSSATPPKETSKPEQPAFIIGDGSVIIETVMSNNKVSGKFIDYKTILSQLPGGTK